MAAEVIGVAVKVDRQALRELTLRDYDAVAGAILQEFDRIAVHRGCESNLETFKLGIINLRNIVFRRNYIRIIIFRCRIFIVDILVIMMKQTHPITVVRRSFILICCCREVPAGNELLRCICAISIYISAKVAPGYGNIRRSIALINRNISSINAIFDRDVCAKTEDVSLKRAATQRVLSIGKTVAIGVIIESIRTAV